jgi:murein DD-endopeptidase MepM/ murein hydrolase activator NlpD
MGRQSSRGANGAQVPSGAARRFRVLAAALALALLPALGGIAPSNASVVADYPSWEEVVAAQKNEARAKALRASLLGQLDGLQEAAQRTQKIADEKGEIYAVAKQAYDEQKIETDALVEQTAAAQAEADEAYAVAAQVIAEMSKSGGSADISPQLFTTPGSPDALLDRLELSRVIGDRYADLYAKAIELRNRADALAAQAEVAQAILEELRIKAEKAYEEARDAAIAAQEKLEQTERDIAAVRSRIEYLAGLRKEATDGYNEGLREQWGDNAAGEISQSGWARPVSGYISSHFGWRINPVTHYRQFHTGVDLAGMGCGATIRAAHAGVVTYAGWYGSWGYYVEINHNNGTGSGYAHIQPGGIGVRIGQHVDPGQPIAKVGSTGQSTGCHLHYIVRVNGNSDLTNPVPFMRKQGITLG